MTRSKTIRRLAAVAPAILDAWSKQDTGRGRCIFSTAVGIKVLEQLGIPAAPLPVRASIWNSAWARLRPGATADDMRELGAWCVSVGPGLPGFYTSDPSGGWDAHLIIHAGGMAIDLDSGSMNRPLKGLHVPAALVFPWHPRGVEGTDERTYFRYEPITDSSFTTAKDWTADHAAIVAEIVRAIRKDK